MKAYFFKNRTSIIAAASVLIGSLVAFLISWIILHAIALAGNIDMQSVIVLLKVEAILRPVMAVLTCLVALRIANRVEKKNRRPMISTKLTIGASAITFVLNFIVSAVQFFYGLYGLY